MPHRSIRKKARIKKSIRGKNSIVKKLAFLILLPVLIVFAFVIFINSTGKMYNLLSRISLVTLNSDGDAVVAVFDKNGSEITTIKIPGNTQISASNQLGQWKIKSLWKLGIDEKLNGNLLKNSVVKTFHFPVTAWADKEAIGFTSGKFGDLVKAVFGRYSTNLGFGDRLKLAFFSLGVKSGKRNDINLAKTDFIQKTKLTDGEDGYKAVENQQDASILAVFSDTSSEALKAVIHNATGGSVVAENVGESIETTGIKVAAIIVDDLGNYDCEITSKNREVGLELSYIFGCVLNNKQPDTNIDLNINLGANFAKRF